MPVPVIDIPSARATVRVARSTLTNRRRSRGQSVVEFALVLPFLLILLAGAIDLGRLFYAYVAVTNAAKEGAQYGAIDPLCPDDAGVRCVDPKNVAWHVENEAPNLTNGTPPVSALNPTASCFAPDGAQRIPIKDCKDGDTYVVRVTYSFQLITPILSSIVGNAMTLGAESKAIVLNDAFDPTPGLSIRKLVRYPDATCPTLDPPQTAPCFAPSPIVDPVTGPEPELQTAATTLDYRIIVTNIGGAPLTGLTLKDSAFGTGPNAWPPTSTTCKARPSSAIPFIVGQIYKCDYSRTVSPGSVVNTVTGTAIEISPVTSTVTVTILKPPAFTVTNNLSPYFEGGTGKGPFGSATSLTVVAPPQRLIWYRLSVVNTGDVAATGFTVSATQTLPAPSADCPAAGTTLAPGAPWTCRYSALIGATITNTFTASSAETGPKTAPSALTATTCTGSNKVAPNMIRLTYAQARIAWTTAGFASNKFSPSSGNDSTIVGTQTRQAWACLSGNPSVTVTP